MKIIYKIRSFKISNIFFRNIITSETWIGIMIFFLNIFSVILSAKLHCHLVFLKIILWTYYNILYNFENGWKTCDDYSIDLLVLAPLLISDLFLLLATVIVTLEVRRTLLSILTPLAITPELALLDVTSEVGESGGGTMSGKFVRLSIIYIVYK